MSNHRRKAARIEPTLSQLTQLPVNSGSSVGEAEVHVVKAYGERLFVTQDLLSAMEAKH